MNSKPESPRKRKKAVASPQHAQELSAAPRGDGSNQEDDMGEYRFIFVRWPNGNWTIALDRDYVALEIEEF